MEEDYSEIVVEKYHNIIQGLYDLQNEINDYIEFSEEDENEDEIVRLNMYKRRVEKMLDCVI